MTLPRGAAALAAVAAGLAVAASAGPARAGDPLRVHRTLETDHFVIYYWDPLEPVARRVGVVAEAAHRTLAPAFDHLPREKTLVVIVDDTDSANGFASVLPRNAITLFATAPTSFSELDDHDDWMYGLTVHEYTHILHLDTMAGLPTLYNRIFGKTWAPNQIMPRWVIEGIAVYEESKRSSGGRNRGTRFEQILRIARHADADLSLDQVSGAPRQFPRGNAPYVYGSHFLRYIFDRFGDDTLRQMSHTGGSYAPPFAVNRQIAKVVGQPFTTLYDDWRGYLRDRYGLQELAAERRGLIEGRRLTTSGEGNLFSRYTADGRELVWLAFDGYELAKVRAMPVGADVRRARDLVRHQAMGPFDVLADGSIVFEQGGRPYRRDYAFQDLWRWDARTGHTVRLTKGRRARDPAVSPDERRVAYSQNEHSTSVLAVMDLAPDAPPSIVWRGERFEQAYQPAWSPDGTRIAFSAWRKGGFRDILVVELASGAVEEITRDRAVDMAPQWSADGRYLFFDSDRTGISNIYAYDLGARTLSQVTNVLGGAFQARPSPDGARLAYAGAVPRGGYDLFEVTLDPARWLPARPYLDDRPPPSAIRDDSAAVSASRPYRAVETLAPRAWTAGLQLGDQPSATIQTGGNDAFGLHNYQLTLATDLRTGDTNIGGSYAYTRLRQAVRFAGARTLVERGGLRIDGVSRTFTEEQWAGTISSSIPFEQRPHASWSLSFDYDLDWFRVVDEPMLVLDPGQRVPVRPPTDYVQSGVGSRLAFSTSRGTIWPVGPQLGFDASVAFRVDHPALGATYKNVTLSYTLNHFQRLPWGRTPVLATRLAGALRAGDLVRTGAFGLGGVPVQDVAMAIVNSTRAGATGFLRGYPTRSVAGNQYHLLNLEYRQLLWNVERGLGTLPFYLRRLHLGLLSDVGVAFDTELDLAQHGRASVGGVLRLDAFFGHFVPGTFELGYARGLTAGGIGQTWFLLTTSL